VVVISTLTQHATSPSGWTWLKLIHIW